MGTIDRSMQLAGASWKVLRADKELLWLPVMSGAASLITAATFVVPWLATVDLEDPQAALGTGSYIALFFLYIVLAYITIFFNTALISAAHERMSGGDPTLGSALADARSHAGAILPWAVISGTVSFVLKALEERLGLGGRLVTGMIGVTWSVVTFLVLPIMIIERKPVGRAIDKSTTLFRETWGENLTAQVGLSMVSLLAMIPAGFVAALGVPQGGVRMVGSLVFAMLWMLVVAVVMSAMSAVFQTALYHYAVDSHLPARWFPPRLMAQAFSSKRKSSAWG